MPSKKETKTGVCYIRARSAGDIARLACDFDRNIGQLYYTGSKGDYWVLYIGERVDNASLVYYSSVKAVSNVVRYSPCNKSEEVEFVGGMEGTATPDTYYMNMIGMDLSSMKEVKGIKKESVVKVAISSVGELVKMAINAAVKDEKLGHLYVFEKGGKELVGAFDMVDELSNDKRVFYYAASNRKIAESFARYNYTTGELSFSDSAGEHSYMYVKLVHLTEPFSFL